MHGPAPLSLALASLFVVAAGGAAHARHQLVIPPGQERVLGRMVGYGDVVLPGACRLRRASALKTRVELLYACQDPPGEPRMTLHPPTFRGEALGRTAKFVLVAVAGEPTPPRPLVDALLARLGGGEGRWHWMKVHGETGDVPAFEPTAPPPPDVAGQPELDPAHIALYEKGLELYRSQRYSEAAATFLELARQNPRFSGVLGMTVANLAPTHPDEAALARYYAAADAAPDDPLPSFVAGVASHYSAHYTAATPERKRQLYRASIRYLERTRPAFDFEPRVFIYLAVSHYRLGEQALAEELIEKAVAIAANDPDAYYCRAEIWHRKDPERALADLQTYLDMTGRFREAGGWVADEKMALVEDMRAYLTRVKAGETPLREIFDPLAGGVGEDDPRAVVRAGEPAPAAPEPAPVDAPVLEAPRSYGALVLAVAGAVGVLVLAGLLLGRARRRASRAA